MCVECKLIDYNPDTCIMRGEIINVSAEESILGDSGKIDPAKLSPSALTPSTMHIMSSATRLAMLSRMACP